ncbi:MAG: spermidine/putrescine ABC transporter substrate-binding protein [Anaerolineales bacterium]|nr:spermidine/putrescine ABC transporter substrate-binding protein [Anaerolineales bacterium]
MLQKTLFKVFAVLAIFSFALTACGGKNANAPADGAKVTKDGFVCPEPNPRVEVTSKELNLFVWTEYIPNEWKDCFELVYGVKINHSEYSANEEMYAKLAAGGSNYDLVLPTDYAISPMIRNGLLQKLDKSKLPVLANLNPAYMDQAFDPGNQYTIPYEGGLDAIVYNSDTVENPPTSYADLWNPEYAGRIVTVDDSRVIIGMTLLTLGYDVNTKDPAQLKEAKEKLAKLIPSIKIFDSDSPKTALIAGDVDLGIVWTGEAFTAFQENPAFKFVYPTEGSVIWQDNWAIPTGAPHLDAAYAWINYTMQGDLFYLMLRDFPYLNPDTAALDYAKTNAPDLYDPFFNSTITNPPLEALKAAHRIDDVGEALPLYDQIWTEVKGGN